MKKPRKNKRREYKLRDRYERVVARAAESLICGECGQGWEEPPCGPSHAVVAGFRNGRLTANDVRAVVKEAVDGLLKLP